MSDTTLTPDELAELRRDFTSRLHDYEYSEVRVNVGTMRALIAAAERDSEHATLRGAAGRIAKRFPYERNPARHRGADLHDRSCERVCDADASCTCGLDADLATIGLAARDATEPVRNPWSADRHAEDRDPDPTEPAKCLLCGVREDAHPAPMMPGCSGFITARKEGGR